MQDSQFDGILFASVDVSDEERSYEHDNETTPRADTRVAT
jgi:hypothetical protein